MKTLVTGSLAAVVKEDCGCEARVSAYSMEVVQLTAILCPEHQVGTDTTKRLCKFALHDLFDVLVHSV